MKVKSENWKRRVKDEGQIDPKECLEIRSQAAGNVQVSVHPVRPAQDDDDNNSDGNSRGLEPGANASRRIGRMPASAKFVRQLVHQDGPSQGVPCDKTSLRCRDSLRREEHHVDVIVDDDGPSREGPARAERRAQAIGR